MKPQKAIIVIARRLLKVVYKTLNEGIIYEEGGVELFTKIQLENRARAQARFLKKQMQQKMSKEQKDDLFLESQKSGTQVAWIIFLETRLAIL